MNKRNVLQSMALLAAMASASVAVFDLAIESKNPHLRPITKTLICIKNFGCTLRYIMCDCIGCREVENRSASL
jgi:hypothetical protein